MIDTLEFQDCMRDKGWCLFPHFVPHNLVQRMIVDLEKAYAFCRKIQTRNGIENSEGTAHHLVGLGGSFMDYLDAFEPLNPYAEAYFGGKYILNSFGGNILKKGMSYAGHIHRDIRSFSGDIPLMLNTIVMLDDFTEENGATWIMEGGHQVPEKPSEYDFQAKAAQMTGSAGSVAMFNSNAWHCAGRNWTDAPRRSVTPLLARPFFKQGYDYPRALGYNHGSDFSPWLQQILGFNSRVPSTLDEWYRPAETRMYRKDQG